LKTEAHLNNIKKFSSYFEENTMRLHYKDQLVNAVYGTIAVYFENHTKHTNTLCGQNAELLNVKASGTGTYSWAKKG
jgi:hypothetical protein